MSVTPPLLSPTIDDVAALIRARTKDSSGNEVGTFTSETRPTALQAQQAIDHQMILVHQKVGTVGNRCSALCRMVVALGAAAEIELSYFPEQARTDRSPYQYLIERWQEGLDGLLECVQGNLPDCAGDATDGTGGVRWGTLDAISSTVNAYYTGRAWPALPAPPPLPDDGNGGIAN